MYFDGSWPVFEAVTTSTSLHSCAATGSQAARQPASQSASQLAKSVSQSVIQKPAEMLP